MEDIILSEETSNIMKANFLEYLRKKRNQLLSESDKYMLNDYPISDEDKVKIIQYRKELRDFMELDIIKNFDGNIMEVEKLLPMLP